MYDTSGKPQIYPRTPQPRKRKVSVFDLVQALEKALEVENRRKKSQTKHEKTSIKTSRKTFRSRKEYEYSIWKGRDTLQEQRKIRIKF